MFDLKGKIAIVTGSARGIGQAIAIELARAGADVVVTDVIPGDKTVDKIKKLKRKSFFVKTDVSNKKEVKSLMNETIKRFKQIDILVSNAGIFIPNSTLNVTEEEWDKTIAVNLKGCFLCSQAAAKFMKRGSSIINTASVIGLFGYPQAAAYCSSKGGIVLLTKSLAAEFGNKGIRVNAVCPGIIETPMTRDLLADEKAKQGLIAKIPLARAGKPKDIAPAVVFLASEGASYITGQAIVIDGGWICAL